ncbi:3-keto-disaccharide hydrolase [Pelagicoccus mobilis]|uniref:DUF1080 domain-containing protein n=1 Tax=Pelagicoccus mobilis TaxID=415221 RepID=A0A934S3J1_9BACT|nr:DUF1080 domain-containing protein [Pelagicoccus mobilis]MBK1878754.1 DUF1080 domain-containing protein [Pelagicoccus mobilis]
MKPHLIALCVLRFCPALMAGDWLELFDGESLAGWSVQCQSEDKGKGYWTAQEGYIQCDSMGDKDHDYVWLQYDREFSDFELRLEFRAFRESKGNSGVQFRSRYDPSPDAPRGGWLDGPQADIHPHGPFRNGLIYDETRTEKRWISPSLPDWRITPEQGAQTYKFHFSDEGNGWNQMVIRCEGNRVQTWVNGVQVRDWDGSGVLDSEGHQRHRVGRSGFIALQLHSKDELKIHFQNLKLKEL